MPVARNDGIGRKLGEWLEREPALVQERVRHRQPRLVDDTIAVEKEIEVDRPRAVPLAATDTPERALDVEEDLSNSRGSSSVSTATTPFRNEGCSTGPHGSVSRRLESPTTSNASDSPRSSTARRIVASRSPRFAPTPTYARMPRP